MKFKQDENAVIIWDAQNDKVLAKFEDGFFETNDEDVIKKMTDLGFDYELPSKDATPKEVPFKKMGADAQVEYIRAKSWTLEELSALEYESPKAKALNEIEAAKLALLKVQVEATEGLEVADDDTIETLEQKLADAADATELADLKAKVEAIEGLEVTDDDTKESLEKKLADATKKDGE